jgi:hypothetical protein
MIERLDQNIEGLENWIKYSIPQSEFESKTSTFYNPDLGSGQIVKIITKILRENGHSDENISKRIFASTNDKFTFLYFQSNSYDALGNFFFEKKSRSINVDWVISLPKFTDSNDTTNLLNKWIEISNKGCAVMFGTKAILDKKVKSDKQLKELLSTYLSKLIFIPPMAFGKESVQTPLGFYLLSKQKENNNIVVFNSINNTEDTYQNIYHITEFGNDKTFHKIRKKYIDYCKNIGSLENIIYSLSAIKNNSKRYKLSIPCQRGHIQQSKTETSFFSNDFYSFLSFNGKIHGDITTMLPDVKRMNIITSSNKTELENIREYTKTPMARFGLTFGKFDTTQLPSTFRFVPLFNFTKKVTEISFQKALDLTAGELNWIKKNMKKYM